MVRAARPPLRRPRYGEWIVGKRAVARLFLIFPLLVAPPRGDADDGVLARCRRAAEATHAEAQFVLERRDGAWQAVGLDVDGGADPETWDLAPLAGLEALTVSSSRASPRGTARFAALRRLRSLVVFWSVRAKDLAAICTLPGLELLSLRYHDASAGETGLAPLRNLEHLRSLRLDGGEFTDMCLGSLKGLIALERLGVGGRGITGAGFADLRSLPNLHELDLNWDNRTISRLPELSGLRRLRFRNLDDSGLSALKKLPLLDELEVITLESAHGNIDLSSLGGLRRLRLGQVIAGDDRAQVLLPPGLRNLTVVNAETVAKLSLASCTEIECLDIDVDCPFPLERTGGADRLLSLPKLRELTMRYPNDPEVAAVSRITGLRALTITRGPAACSPRDSEDGLKAIAGLGGLEYLSLARPNDAVMETVRNFRNLRHLVLEYPASLTAKGLAKISELRQLRELDFILIGDLSEPIRAMLERPGALAELQELSLHGQLPDNGLARLAVLKNLRRLDLRLCNGFTDAGVRSMLRALPDLRQLEFTLTPESLSDRGKK